MQDTTADARTGNEKTSSRWVGLYFGLGVQVVTRVLGYWLLLPVAFGLTVFLLNLLAYPLFFHDNPHRARWMLKWGFREFIIFNAAAGVGCSAFFYAVLKVLHVPLNFHF